MTSKSITAQQRTKRSALKTSLLSVPLILIAQVTPFSASWAQTPEADSSAPLLTLDEAVRIASGANREIQISKFEIIKAKEIVAQARTNYLPKLDANVLAGLPMQPLNFRVPAGSFGTYPATGPIPATDSNIHSPVRFGAFINGSATQPLTQLFKVSLAVTQARLGVDLAKEGLRAQNQDTVRQVKEAYYQVSQLQAQIASARAAVQSLSELATLTDQRLAQETVMQSVADRTKCARATEAKLQPAPGTRLAHSLLGGNAAFRRASRMGSRNCSKAGFGTAARTA
jgi:outer membrane protein TolC